MKSSLMLRAAICLAAVSFARPASAEFIRAIASQAGIQFLVTWDSATPASLAEAREINVGSPPVLAIDTRPATGELYVLVASQGGPVGSMGIGTLTNFQDGMMVTEIGGGVTALKSFSHGFDFNPVIDRVRTVGDLDNNIVFNPNTGAVDTVGTNLFYAAGDPNAGVNPNVSALAYSNNFPGATSTTIYGIDTALNVLVTQAGNSGALTTVGALGVDATSLTGFDISGATGTAYATLTPANSSQSIFYTINLATGAATAVGPIGGGLVITAMTVGAIPEPATTSLVLAGLVATLATRRRR